MKRSIAAASAVTIVAAAAALGLWQTLRSPVTLRSAPRAVMGTRCELTIVVARHRAGRGEEALAAAAGALRDVEATMSHRLAGSALSRFNAAGPGEEVALPEELLLLLRRSDEIAHESDGAFDVTCRPVIELWREGEKTDREPAPQRIAEVLQRVGMRHLKLDGRGATKLIAGLEVDLGGIAKGYAVDQATRVLQSCPGASGGIVNAGGDLRCFGTNRDGQPWRVGVQHPFREGLCGTLLLADAAAATSGDYRRHFEIAGRRYSHIVDPRTGRPVQQTPSVTVVCLPAAGREVSATDADAWATALSVLGPAGLERLEKKAGFEAMIVTGTPADPKIHTTKGFRRLLEGAGEIRLD